jgi:PAS domain S-box-containing protein
MNERTDAAARRSVTAARIAFACASIVALCGLSGVASMLGLEYLPRSTTPAIVAILLLGAAMFLQLAGRSAWVLACAVPVSIGGVVVLVAFVFGATQTDTRALLPIGGLPPNSAAGFACAAFALAWSALQRRGTGRIGIVLLAMTCASIGAIALFGRAAGIESGIGWSLGRSASVVTGVSLLACGIGIAVMRPATPTSGDDHTDSAPSGLIAAATVLFIALGATAFAWRAAANAVTAQRQQQFVSTSTQVAAAIRARLLGYVDILHGVQGLFAASQHVDVDEWKRYHDRLDVDARYPGVQAMGYAPRVSAAKLAAYENGMRTLGHSDHAVFPRDDAADHYPVEYIEPLTPGNMARIGFDLGTDPVRRRAIERAIARDEAALSGRIDVAASDGRERGFTIFVPLHGGRADEDPPNATDGVGYFEFRASDWIRPLLTDDREGIRLQLYDGETADADSLLHADADFDRIGDAEPPLERTIPIDFAGHRWTLRVRAGPEFFLAHRSQAPLWVLLGGLASGHLLFAIVWSLAGTRARAMTLARRMTDELHDSQRAFQAVADTATDAIVSADSAGRIRYLNRAASAGFGWSIDDAREQPLTILMPERFRAMHDAGMQRFLATGEARVIGRTLELVGLRRDGSEFPIEISIARWDNAGEPNFTAIVRDISERKRSELALEDQRLQLSRSNADLEQFAYVASHDLQEPLRMVASYVQLLARRYKDKLGEDANEFIGFAVDGALRMQQLIDDLLVYSRVGARDDRKRAIALGDCVAAALRNLGERMRETRGSVDYDELPTVHADPGQLTQLMQNLIGNALKFAGTEPPRVRIDAVRDGDFWRIGVHDHGIGIDPQYAERIFVIFQRLHTRAQYAGTGIGLAICKKIVERAGGRIWVESRPGNGASFFFTLPLVQNPA